MSGAVRDDALHRHVLAVGGVHRLAGVAKLLELFEDVDRERAIGLDLGDREPLGAKVRVAAQLDKELAHLHLVRGRLRVRVRVRLRVRVGVRVRARVRVRASPNPNPNLHLRDLTRGDVADTAGAPPLLVLVLVRVRVRVRVRVSVRVGVRVRVRVRIRVRVRVRVTSGW